MKFPEKYPWKTSLSLRLQAEGLKVPGNEFFKDIDNNNGTSCFIE